MKFRLKKFVDKLRAGWRDTWLLLAEFRLPLFWFVSLLVGSGLLYHKLSSTTVYATHDLPEAIYLMLMLIFLQGFGEFPQIWFLQIFFFVMPFLGMAILAQGLADFGIMLFNRRARGKEWEMAVASTYRNHVVLIGLGHLGYRVVMKLREMDQEVVVIELSPKTDLVNVVRKLGVPVIADDGTRDDVLQALHKRQRRFRRRGQRPKALRQTTGAAQVTRTIVGQIHLMTRSHDLPRPIQGHRRAGAENEEF